MTEPVLIARTGAALSALVDPSQRKLYFLDHADIEQGDVASFRGASRRIISPVEVWEGAGSVAEFEPAPAYLPDAGNLFRSTTGLGPINDDTGLREPITDGPAVWSGACAAEPREADGTSPDVGDQRVGVVPFIVTVPLSLTDVRPGDVFKVTQSRDFRLTQRSLVVTAVRGSSSDLTREVLAFDNQGGL